MKINLNKLKAIEIAEKYYQSFEKNKFKKFFGISFKFNKENAYKPQSLKELWISYGLHNSKKYNFSTQTKIACLTKWIEVLCDEKIDVQNIFQNKIDVSNAKARKLIEKNPGVHFNLKYPTFNEILDEISNKFENNF